MHCYYGAVFGVLAQAAGGARASRATCRGRVRRHMPGRPSGDPSRCLLIRILYFMGNASLATILRSPGHLVNPTIESIHDAYALWYIFTTPNGSRKSCD